MQNVPELEYISWDKFHKMGFELAQKIQNSDTQFDQILSISRGGHVVSRILSDFLGLPIFSVSIQSYTSIQQQGELEITQEIAPELLDENILLVDEVVDSGKTLERAREYLAELEAKNVTAVSYHVKPHAIARPDIYIAETSKWIIYPYEVRESVKALVPIWKEAGLELQDLSEKLIGFGIPREFIEFYLNKES